MKNLLLLTYLCFLSNLLFAVPYEIDDGEILTVNVLTVVSMPDGIIVHDGGQIIIQPQGYLLIGEGAEIVVEDGGKIYGNGGLMGPISSATGWGGVLVEAGAPSSTLAVELYHFNISGSDDFGLEVRGGANGARRVYCENVFFDDNYYSHVFISCNSNGLDIPNGSVFKGCTFYNYAGWQVKTSFTNDLTFDGCTFTGDAFSSGTINLHMDQCRNTTITNCTFEYGGRAIGLHYEVIDASVSNNTFYQKKASTGARGVELGFEGSSNTIENVSIFRNSFYPFSEGTGTAIAAGWASATLNNVRISVNDIYGDGDGFDIGVHVTNASGSNSHVNGNAIYGTQYGIKAEGNNSSLNIFCNGFDRNFYHIYNGGTLANQSTSGIDPNNKFYDTGSHDIYNAGPGPFTYYVHPWTPYQPLVNQGVNITNVFNIYKCKRNVGDEMAIDMAEKHSQINKRLDDNAETRDKIETKFEAGKVSVHPNPASEYLIVENSDKLAMSQIVIFNSRGQINIYYPSQQFYSYR